MPAILKLVRHWLLAALALAAIWPAITNAQDVRTRRQPLNVASQKIWDKRSISVCWETGGYAGGKAHVRQAVKDSWEANSRLVFTGWESCKFGTGANIQIKIADEGPHVTDLGKDLDNDRDGMVLNFTFKNWKPSCGNQGEAKRTSCIKTIAVHEFGHALGFAHEQNRPDALCAEENQGSDGNVFVGVWDLNSAMNYCRTNWDTNGALSASDIEGVQIFYGVPANRLVPPPAGTYRGSCAGTQTTATLLISTCKGNSGTIYVTSLPDYRKCTGDITNRDGRLLCSSTNTLPGGTWKASCIDAAVQGDTLAASCKNKDGDFKRTQLVGFSSCNASSIANNDGVLICSRGAIPAGSYQASCRMFQRKGNELYAQCRQSDGDWVNSSIKRVDLCTGLISNNDGILRCTNGRTAPEGSYRNSCRAWFADGPDLVASCSKDGEHQPTRLVDFPACRAKPFVKDGALVCSK